MSQLGGLLGFGEGEGGRQETSETSATKEACATQGVSQGCAKLVPDCARITSKKENSAKMSA